MKKFIISVLVVCAFAGIMSVSAWDEVFFDDFSSGRVRIGRFSVRAGGEVVIDTPEGGEEA